MVKRPAAAAPAAPGLLVLDDPFSAVDVDTEARIVAALREASDRDPAILFVASDEPTLKALALYQKHGRTEAGETVRLG